MPKTQTVYHFYCVLSTHSFHVFYLQDPYHEEWHPLYSFGSDRVVPANVPNHYSVYLLIRLFRAFLMHAANPRRLCQMWNPFVV